MSNVWRKLSARERRLAVGAATLLALGVVYVLGVVAFRSLETLDSSIASLEAEVLTNSRLADRRGDVEQALGDIAAEHSSEWTQAEIHDRLLQEITRLSLREVLPPGAPAPANGQPLARLLQIPAIRSGRLSSTGEGYRSYQINVKPAAAPINDVVLFLQRLEESPQALRIDNLTLMRQPATDLVGADITVTRTVIDGMAETGASEAGESPMADAPGRDLARNGSFEEWDEDNAQFPDWEIEGCDVAQAAEQATMGAKCLRANASRDEASRDEGVIYQRHDLEAGESYDLFVDAVAAGDVDLSVVAESTSKPLEGTNVRVLSECMHQYTLQLTVPGTPGERVALLVPHFRLKGAGARVFVDNVVLMKREQ